MYTHTPPQPLFGGAWCYAALCICPRPSSSAVVWWFETMAERSAYAPPPRPLLNRCLVEQGAMLRSVYAHAPPQRSFGGLKQWRNSPPPPLLPAPPQPSFGGAGCYAVLCTPTLEALSTFSTYVHSHLRGVAPWSLCSVYAHPLPFVAAIELIHHVGTISIMLAVVYARYVYLYLTQFQCCCLL